MNTHQVLIIIVDTRILCCVADSLQERRFASIGPSDYKYTKASVFRSKIIGIAVAHHGRCVKDKEITWEQYHSRSWSRPHAASCMASCRGFGFSLDLKNQISIIKSIILRRTWRYISNISTDWHTRCIRFAGRIFGEYHGRMAAFTMFAGCEWHNLLLYYLTRLVYLSLYSERSQILYCTVVTNRQVHQREKW